MRQTLLILSVLASEIIVSLLIAKSTLWYPWQRGFLVVGTIDQFIGVVLAAWPDLENTLRVAISLSRLELAEGIRQTRRKIHSARAKVWWWLQARAEDVANWYRRVRGRPRRLTIRLEPAVIHKSGGVADVVVRRGGTIEERLERVENEVRRMPGLWQADFASLRDARVQFRWYGVFLILIGIVFLGVAGSS